jgi:2-oxoglutarate ferredoxin oxidoreductase subunit delta
MTDKKQTRRPKKRSGKAPKKSESAGKGVSKKGGKQFAQTIFRDWCKACGICMAFCPKDVIGKDEAGRPHIRRPEDCIGCRFCELHCPDFAITITEKSPESQGNRR